MDNKQYPYGQGTPYPPAPGLGYAPAPGMGYAPGGAIPPTGFAGPGYASPQGYAPQAGFSNQGYGINPPQMGFNIPPEDSAPKPYSNESGSSYGDIHGLDFSERTIRMAFIRKVYGILSVQLLLTTAIIALFSLHQPTKLWVRGNPGFMFGSYIVAIILLIAIACCESVRRKSPQNLIMLGLFTLTYGIVIGVIASTYNIQSIVLAAGVTVVVCVALTIFSFQTKYDFTMMGGALFVCCIVLFLFGILAIFIRVPWVHMLLAAAGALLFSVYLVYDTQLMMGGNHKYSLSPEEYIFAALNIYMDVIMIFIYLLRLFGSRD